jgi:hypothetical protein
LRGDEVAFEPLNLSEPLAESLVRGDDDDDEESCRGEPRPDTLVTPFVTDFFVPFFVLVNLENFFIISAKKFSCEKKLKTKKLLS